MVGYGPRSELKPCIAFHSYTLNVKIMRKTDSEHIEVIDGFCLLRSIINNKEHAVKK